MSRKLVIVAVAALLVPGYAQADLGNLIEICGGAKSTPHEIVNFCQKAIDTGQLDRETRAQVYANLSIGYFELNQFLGAIAAADKALADDPRLVPALLYRARSYEKLQKLKEAAADYEMALALEPNSAEAFMGRGIMFQRHGRPYEAIQDLSKALLIEPELTVARFNRGLGYLEIGQPSRAEADFTDLIRRNGQDAEAYLYRGQARAALNQPNAAEDFDKALSLAEEWGLAWFVRGRYRDGLGDKEGANADFLRAYELGHNDPWLIQRIREISG